MNKQGLLLCAKYAISPNFFGYCGPKKSLSLIDHLKDKIADNEVQNILSEFETMHPYLQMIAYENQINDPYDPRVVNAYWLGNALLKSVKRTDYLSFFQEKIKLEKKATGQKIILMKQKLLRNNFLPNHSFHVFNIFKMLASDLSSDVLTTMEECRINWGKVISNNKANEKKINFDPRFIFVSTSSLRIGKQGKLVLEKNNFRKLRLDYKGNSFLDKVKSGDFISFHWGQVCDVISKAQARQLDFYTNKAVEFFNS